MAGGHSIVCHSKNSIEFAESIKKTCFYFGEVSIFNIKSPILTVSHVTELPIVEDVEFGATIARISTQHVKFLWIHG
jgi:hypothetical protein